jgi:ribonuclease J
MKLKIIPLGGMGNVTKNMFVYEYDDELLIVDCGIGFPEKYMLGVDILIPDVAYIQRRLKEGARIVGLCLTHGHDDHIAALPWVLPMLPDDFPIFGSPLTAAFAMQRMEDSAVQRSVNTYPERDPLKLGKYFSVENIRVTHSVPDARHLVIYTPEGICYHGSDFKFDMNPVDGVRSDFSSMAAVGQKGVLCALVDCLRVERTKWSPSESIIYEALEREIRDCRGKLLITLMSSNLYRIQQSIDVAVEHNRKVVFVGRSIEQNAEIAQMLHMLKIPRGTLVQKKQMDEYRDNQLVVIIAGSQGQPGSSLVRAVYGDHPLITIGKNDKVVFSTEPIPGNEQNVYDTIDELTRNGVDVAYSDVDDNLHVSGHAGQIEQQLLVSLVKAKFVFPIGGTDRHRVLFKKMATQLAYQDRDVLLPKNGQIVEFSRGEAQLGETLFLKDLMVDGLGVGDVGDIVLADRKKMAEEGMVVVIIPESGGVLDAEHTSVVSRGFVFMKRADEMVQAIKDETAEVVNENREMPETELKKLIEKKLTKRLDKLIGRTPLVLPVFYSA